MPSDSGVARNADHAELRKRAPNHQCLINLKSFLDRTRLSKVGPMVRPVYVQSRKVEVPVCFQPFGKVQLTKRLARGRMDVAGKTANQRARLLHPC